MKLHRTPVHHDVLVLVRDRRVMRQEAAAPGPKGVPVLRRSAGFAHHTGRRLELDVLVALWELRQHKLITVSGGVVSLSSDGRDRLAEWDATRSAVR